MPFTDCLIALIPLGNGKKNYRANCQFLVDYVKIKVVIKTKLEYIIYEFAKRKGRKA